jgi:hypothetical protein
VIMDRILLGKVFQSQSNLVKNTNTTKSQIKAMQNEFFFIDVLNQSLHL